MLNYRKKEERTAMIRRKQEKWAPAKDKIIRSTLRNRYRNFILLKDQKNKTWNDKLKEVNVENS